MRTWRRGTAARVALMVTLAGFTSACYSAWGGYWPPVERLDELRPGISSRADVEALLGTPLGRGMARFTPESAPREVWIYARAGYPGRGTSFHNAQLVVFLDDGRYDGHYWTIVGKPLEPSTGAGR